ncbi:AsmA family protein [Leptospira idonii]|uniref:AsmA family protein n=1 Tax=Leptospira idonii TaxID=1193500 RepID=A0A4R9M263_9LEPT|nr:AsmA family protein [Leptospira idonii]TGN20840.1 AsmA family protein [Leptospira idonii]
MKITFGERLKGFVGKTLLGSIVIGSTGLFFLLYPLISEPDYYKNLILSEANKITNLSFDYTESNPTFFPFPGIELRNVTVSKNEEQLIRVQKLKIEIYFGIFLGKALEIRKIYLNTGKIELVREKDESFPLLEKFIGKDTQPEVPGKDENTIVDKLLFSEVFAPIPNGLDLNNIMIEFQDKLYNRKINFYVWESKIELDKALHSLYLSLYGKINEETFQLYTDVLFLEDELSYENMRLEGSAHFDHFGGENLKDILVIFPNAEFKYGHLTGVIPFYKRTSNVIYAKVERVNIRDLAKKGGTPFGDAYISANISYDTKETKLSFTDISAEWKGRIRIAGSGFITFVPPPLSPTIYFEGRSDYLDADTTINVTKLWIDADLEKSLITRNMPSTGYVNRMNVYLDFNLRRVNLRGVFADQMNFSLHYNKSVMKIRKLHLLFYRGILNATGSYQWGKNPQLFLSGKSTDVSLRDLIDDRFGNSPITGTLETNFEVSSPGADEDELIRNMKINASFKSQNGELLSYTNILKPISSIGSLISLKKFDFNRATPYTEINVDMHYYNRMFQFSNFSLKADGIAGSGGGNINLDKKIDMKFTIALPGVAGKVLKLPIIYKGTYGVSAPLIDPIWLGSVYAGTLLLAGPAGATVGGIAGSAVSEYVGKAVDNVTDTVQSGWKSLKGLFSSEQEPPPKSPNPNK